MKNFILLCFILLFVIPGFSQTWKPDQKWIFAHARFFKSHHISLAAYDFSNPEINANLLVATKTNKWRNTNGLMGLGSMVVGLGTMMILSTADESGEFYWADDALTLPVLSGLVVAAVPLLVLSITRGPRLRKALNRSRELLMQ